jgi:signal transduction histidine kinase
LGVKSLVGVPLLVGAKVAGALVLTTLGTERTWRDDLVQRLRLFGEVLAQALSRRQSEMEAQQLRQELAHVARTATIGQLTTSLAHELNQPLTAILSNAQAAQRFLAADPVDLEEVRDILKDIVDDDKRAGEVIHRLRNLLKKGNPEFRALDLNETVGEVARLVSGDALLRGVSIQLALAPGLPPVRGDRVPLQQVILNLVLNGMDAMRKSSPQDRILLLRTARVSPTVVRVAVRDSGVGVGEGNRDEMFQAFYTTKEDGMGMGLAIARSIVEAHGGRLEGHSNSGPGATFSFTLPIGDEGQ